MKSNLRRLTLGLLQNGSFSRLIKVVLPLATIGLCLFEYRLSLYCGIFREFEATLLSLQWMLLVCIAGWSASFIFLKFSLNDLPLVGLLLIAIIACFICYAAALRAIDAITLLSGVTLGRGAKFFFGSQKSEVRSFLIGLVVLLFFSSWWHLDMTGAYHGPRWMGLWNNPNDYGMLMGAGTALVIALQVLSLKSKVQSPKLNTAKTIFLSVAIFMMAVGLVMSYSRGAWLGTVVGLLYLAWSYGKLKWRYVVTGFGLVALGILLFWGRTPDSSAWYVKRMDLGRPSAQHRVAAWKAGFEIMRDHPFGVGWNKTVETYEKNYSPPENGAYAISMNSYLMLGTQLGLPALLFFIVYIYFKFRSKTANLLQVACRAGALVLLVAFWFDGGLFDLPTAAVFWILLELGTSDLVANRKSSHKLPSLAH